jgi:hypothetical protein
VIKKSKLFLRVPIVILLLSYSISAHSQDILALRLDGSEQGKSLSDVLLEIENKNNAKFFFLPEWISSLSFSQSHQGQTLEQASSVSLY